MAEGHLFIGTRRYSSWSLRGWLAVRLANLAVDDVVIPLQGGGPGSEVARRSPSGTVPWLEHREVVIWESLAICEYCAEQDPALWPADPAARAHARAIAAEMHAGFRGLRQAMPMVLGPDFSGRGQTSAALADLDRIEAIWSETRARHGDGGPYLFGPTFNAADAMFAPVVARILTYGPPISDTTRAYCQAVRQHPLVRQWYDAAAAEPPEWQLAHYEQAP